MLYVIPIRPLANKRNERTQNEYSRKTQGFWKAPHGRAQGYVSHAGARVDSIRTKMGEYNWKTSVEIVQLRFFLAEAVGFEPTVPWGTTDFESVPLWPLRYASVNIKLVKVIVASATSLIISRTAGNCNTFLKNMWGPASEKCRDRRSEATRAQCLNASVTEPQ